MTADKIKENVEDSLTESIKQKPHQTPIDKEVQESTEPLPEYEKYEQEERESELKTKAAAFDVASIKHQDFIVDLHNKLSRISLSLTTAIIVFLGWIYRDLNSNTDIIYSQLNLNWLVALMIASILSACLLMWSNVLISKRQRMEKEKLYEAQKARAYIEAGSSHVDLAYSKMNESKLKSKLEIYDYWKPITRSLGYLTFVVAVVGIIIFLRQRCECADI